ncbi:aspartic peptidase domain-containing protein [Pestalotiopsis sp. NC0098]|nr:aspartic peptidase domain-containing protein [Pestalotiopsis sp. NC0098]
MLLLSAALLLLHIHLCLAKFPRTYPRPERPAFHTLVAGKPANGAGDPGYIKSSLGTQFVNGSTPAARGRNNNNRSSSIVPRDGREALSEFQAGVVYMMDIDVGTPRQTITVIVDTGSYELFLNPNCARAADQTYCAAAGHYYPAESSTVKNLSSRYYVSFGTGGYVGSYFSDTLWFGDDYWPVSSLQFGVSDDSDYVWAGIIGLGYGQRFNTNYPTLLDLLVSQGYINVPIFSLSVGSQGNGDSEIIVGGVDSHKYIGWLEPLELYPPPETQEAEWKSAQYWINMTSFGYTAPGGSAVTMTAAGFSRIMLVDSGSTYSYIDADLVAALAKQFSATIDESGVYYVSCSYLDVDGYVHFGFNNGAMVINAKYSDFIVDFGSRCALGVQPADAGVNTWVLGATFIRSAYIVFDQLYDAIWLANYQPCGGSLVTDLTENAGNQLWTELYGGC